MTVTEVYEPSSALGWQAVPDVTIVAAALAAGAAAALRPSLAVALVVGAAVAAVARDRRAWLAALVLILGVGLVVAARRSTEEARLRPDRLGPFTGWVELVDDPRPVGSSTYLVVEIDGERFESWLRRHGLARRALAWDAGEWVRVAGERRELAPGRAGRVAARHVVGRFDVAWTGDLAPGGPLARSANRVRMLVERGAAGLPPPDAALLRGLVIGDDREQPQEMIERFRASGLSHLTAVSGQNIAFVLAAAAPLLTRLRPWWRWAATVGLVGWFVVVTRFEPSVVRAGVMAGLSATAFLTGRERRPVRLLGLAVAGLLVVDPLLARSVGFWLSVGATAGVAAVGPWLSRRFAVLGPAAGPVGITLGAQIGVALPSLLMFGRLPLVSVPANLLAVPVAGVVMLVGLPATLVAGAVPTLAPVVTLPLLAGVRWVDTVASLGAALEPPAPWGIAGWAVVAVVAGVVAVASAARNRDRHGDRAAHR
jgi:competence protein ComEC